MDRAVSGAGRFVTRAGKERERRGGGWRERRGDRGGGGNTTLVLIQNSVSME